MDNNEELIELNNKKKISKKGIVIVIAILVILGIVVGVFIAKNKTPKAQVYTVAPGASETVIITTKPVETKAADLTASECLYIVQSYDAKTLLLDDETYKKCDFMVTQNPTVVNNQKYYVITASYKTENEDKTYSFDVKRIYYVNLNGNEILTKQKESDEFTKLNVSIDYKRPTEQTTKGK